MWRPRCRARCPAPVVGYALVEQRSRLRELCDPIGPAAERRRQRGCRDVPLAPIVLWQDRELAETGHDRGVDAVDVEQVEGEVVLAMHFNTLDHAEGRAQVEAGVLANVLEREAHVARGDRHAVMPARFRAQTHTHGAEIVRNHHSLGEIAVERADLVVGRHEQPVVEERVGAQLVLHARRHIALVEVGRERVPAYVRRQHERAAFGRVRVDVVEVFEIGRVLEFAEERHAVPVRRIGRRQCAGTGCGDDQEPQRNHRRRRRSASVRYSSSRSTTLRVRDDSNMPKTTFIVSTLSRPLLMGSRPLVAQSAKCRISLTK